MFTAWPERYAVCGIVVAAAAFLAVAMPAIWSRHAYRREAALKVLRETLRALRRNS
ncbi:MULTISPECIES: hypothetical protein [Streptomyces]|uniref:hypothetical protein n=1 Tax=Streptomyces TaxID=1883 RepID=UPI00331BF018